MSRETPEQQAPPRQGWRRIPAWLPVPLLLGAMAVLWATGLRAPHESPFLLLVCNFLFSMVASLFVAFLVGRSFMVRGAPGLLMLGCAVIIWGLAGVLGSAVTGTDANVLVTIHNIGVALSAVCHLAGALLLLRGRPAMRSAGLWLAAGYTGALAVMGMVTLAVAHHRLPVFFIQGQGGTPLRQFVLGLAIIMFAASAILLWGTQRRSSSRFEYWYCLALALIAVGLFGVLIQTATGSVLGWTGRAAQFLGGAYMIVAAVLSVHEAGVWGVPLEAALRESKERLRLLGDNLPDSALYEYLPEPGKSGRFLYISAGIERLNGVTVAEVLRDAGILHRQILPEYRQPLIEAEARCARELSDFDMEVPMRRPDGQVRWMRMHSRPRPLPDGRVIWVGVQIDITTQKQAEAAVRESQARYRQLVEGAASVILRADPQMRITFMNEYGLRFFGYTPEELIGRSALGTIIPLTDDAGRDIASMAQDLIRHPERYPTNVHQNRRKNGELVWMSWTNQPVYDQQGNFVELLTIGNDLSQLKAAEAALRQSETRYRMLHESLRDAFVQVSMDGRIIDCNDAYCQMLGYSPEEVRTLTYQEITPERWYEAEERIVREQIIARGYSDVYQKEYRRKDGTVFPVELRTVLSRDASGQPVAMWGIVRDITEHKRAEEQMKAARESAERAQAAAEEANKAKDQFLAALSHELRTPLTPVLMLSQMLAEDPEVSESIREDLKTIRQNVLLEARLIDDLLDLTRIARGKVQLKPEIVDVHDLLQHAALTCCDEVFARKRLKLEWDLMAEASTVWADAPRLEQVFWNLIRNAIKFTPEDGRLTIRSANRESGRLHIEVADTGVGIEPDRLAAIFNPFEQGGIETTRRFGGLGLGLAISKAVVELHKGRIEAISAGPGQGAVFRVTLAIAAGVQEAERAGEDASATMEPSGDGHARILLVEDHAATAMVLRRLMRKWGWEVHWADSVRAGKELAARHDFHFVISDLGLPDGSGHDLMRHLRDTYGLSGIAVSGYGMEEDLQRSLSVGFVGHITKPVDFEELRKAISGYLAGAGK